MEYDEYTDMEERAHDAWMHEQHEAFLDQPYPQS